MHFNFDDDDSYKKLALFVSVKMLSFSFFQKMELKVHNTYSMSVVSLIILNFKLTSKKIGSSKNQFST